MSIDTKKLAMVILVKNEIDVIELNVRFHAQMGVSHFIIMDNGSTDGTLERIKKLQKDFNICLIENPTGVYQQSKWMTELAKRARKEFDITHLIPNDADEFWVPKCYKSLPDQIIKYSGVQTLHRFNRVLTSEQAENHLPFWKTDYYVESPILYSKEIQKVKDNISLQLVKISPKVVVKPKGLIKIKGGNHRGSHWHFWTRRRNADITVHHFPIRSYAQFLGNIENRDKLLDKPKVKMAPHYRRWVRQLREGSLQQEFQRMTPAQGQLDVLEQVGVLVKEAKLPVILSDIAAGCTTDGAIL